MTGVLKKEHLEALRKLDESCANTREFLQSCKDCYINVDQEIADNEEQAKICEAIRKRAFPTAQ